MTGTSRLKLPVSTTHVSVGSLFGIGVVNVADQFKTLDSRARNAELADTVDVSTVEDVSGLYLSRIDTENIFMLTDEDPGGP